jgi:predicted amidohydrolase YtcJ
MTHRGLPADLVLSGGRVLTMEPAGEATKKPVQAVAVRAARIVAVGTVSDVERHVGR